MCCSSPGCLLTYYFSTFFCMFCASRKIYKIDITFSKPGTYWGGGGDYLNACPIGTPFAERSSKISLGNFRGLAFESKCFPQWMAIRISLRRRAKKTGHRGLNNGTTLASEAKYLVPLGRWVGTIYIWKKGGGAGIDRRDIDIYTFRRRVSNYSKGRGMFHLASLRVIWGKKWEIFVYASIPGISLYIPSSMIKACWANPAVYCILFVFSSNYKINSPFK